MKAICVFCGSSVGSRPAYAAAARSLGAELVSRNLRLVYGGGSVGLMGVLADAVVQEGGLVTGVIPQALAEKELAHPDAHEMHIVASMHQRKAMMADLSDAFIAMPGGLGTLEELFEVLTWAQLGFHSKPVAIMNVERYFDPLLDFIDSACTEAFIRKVHRSMIIASDEPSKILDALLEYEAPSISKWLGRRTL